MQLNFLCVDTSGEFTLVAASVEGVNSVSRYREGQFHVESLAPLTKEVLSDSGLGLDDLSFIAVVCGPGGFSGLRVGVTFVSVLAQAAALSVVELSRLELAVYGELGEWDYILIIEDGKRQEVFYGLFSGPKDQRTLLEEGHMAPEELTGYLLSKYPQLSNLGQRVLVRGGGLVKYRNRWKSYPTWNENVDLTPPGDASSHLRLAMEKFLRNEVVDPLHVSVSYLREADARPNFRRFDSPIDGGRVET
ncbi:tRNA threonylcarbamoyl adenosine modification protein YeaZ [Ferrithrix thermotolerans DSM 19514]|uniref:tRNA threonylcarbamoyl adenosine modification protein YeaZ n=1 Tax=Ferrithrix thermotolerans DSM 19514 TaxID=1121881 RepID=A0A1M4SV84_9ACTN|nr:tRNA threonylcarbamoyl adenosine modification protein YeaZ [Ferrithrix thermotolerans DSM 19514]